LIRSARPYQAQVTAVQVLFRGEPVEGVARGKKIKKYALQIAGAGFTPGSTVVVNSLGVYPYTIEQPLAQPTSTNFISATSLEAVFLPGVAPKPGLLLVKVVNPDGGESNAVSVDVISKPSELEITAISPGSGPVGTQVTLTGTGFKVAERPEESAIRFEAVGSDETLPQGFYFRSNAENGSLSFAVPSGVIRPVCTGIIIGCDPIATPRVTPQQYRVWVIDPNGMSNSILFSVTAN
jgi:hypothetical protein